MKVTYIDHMGTDLSVVNAARVSFNKQSDFAWSDEGQQISERDKSLIRFLARGCTKHDWDQHVHGLFPNLPAEEIECVLKHVKNMPTHWTPFAHTAITLHIKAPIFVARQLGKHQTGLVWNEVSRRYVDDDPEFFVPEYWRAKSPSAKQGSSNEEVTHLREPLPKLSHSGGCVRQSVGVACDQLKELYEEMLATGVAPEQARMVLPQSMYTQWYWTGNLYSFANVFIQRTDSHAQQETQDIAQQIGFFLERLFPVSWDALTQ